MTVQNEVATVDKTDTPEKRQERELFASSYNLTLPELKVVKDMIAKDLNQAELVVFLHECNRRGTHALDRQIIPQAFTDKQNRRSLTMIITEGYELAAVESTGQLEWMGQPEFTIHADDPAEVKGEPWYMSMSCRIEIKRKGMERPIIAVCHFREYYPGDEKGWMWKKMPRNQLEKVTRVKGYRLAFPKKLSGLYNQEEMAHIVDIPPANDEKPKSLTDQVKETKLVGEDTSAGTKWKNEIVETESAPGVDPHPTEVEQPTMDFEQTSETEIEDPNLTDLRMKIGVLVGDDDPVGYCWIIGDKLGVARDTENFDNLEEFLDFLYSTDNVDQALDIVNKDMGL